MRRMPVGWALVGLLLGLGILGPSESFACQKYRDFVPVSIIIPPNYATVLSGTAITVKIAGSSTNATLYSDKDCVSTTTNPATSASDGSFEFYANDGWYDLTFVKAGYSIAAVNNIAIFTAFGTGVKSVAEFSSPADICATTTGAIDTTGSTTRTLLVNSPVACASNKTIPATLSIICTGQGSVSVSVAVTLAINGPIRNLTDHACFTGSGTVSYGSTATGDPYNKDNDTDLTYSASMTPDRRLGRTQIITVTNTTAFTINAPLPASVPRGTGICVEIRNTSGGAVGAITWNAVFKMAAWTSPATAFNRGICFRWNGTNYVETLRNAADIPN